MAEAGGKALLTYLVVGIAAAWALAGCGANLEGSPVGGASGETHVLSVEESKQALRQLSYRYKFRRVPNPLGAEAAVAGRAIGPHHTVLNFGISLGRRTKGVPVQGVGTAESYGYSRGGFTLTTDMFVRSPSGRLVPGPQFKTEAQWREASHMEVMMTDKLCKAATGKPCPI
jgi:hypothetical protein